MGGDAAATRTSLPDVPGWPRSLPLPQPVIRGLLQPGPCPDPRRDPRPARRNRGWKEKKPFQPQPAACDASAGNAAAGFGGQRRQQRDVPEPGRWRLQVSAADWAGLGRLGWTGRAPGAGRGPERRRPRGAGPGKTRRGRERKIKARKMGINHGEGRGETAGPGFGSGERPCQHGDRGHVTAARRGSPLLWGQTGPCPGAGTPWALRVPEPPSASRPALGAVWAEAMAPARRGPAPPARRHVTQRRATNWATARNRSRRRAGEVRRATAVNAAGPGDVPAAGREPRAWRHRRGLAGAAPGSHRRGQSRRGSTRSPRR